MVIQVGSIYMNKTWEYLTPVLREYGKEFIEKFDSVWKVAVGIGDMILVENNIHYEQHLFILIDTKAGQQYFRLFIKWIREQDMFEDDYCFDSINAGRLHMVIIKLPEKGYKAIVQFKHSQFSKMFESGDIDKYFEKKPHIKKILIKDNEYKFEFVKKLNDVFGATVEPEEYEGELANIVKKEKEYFNVKKKV